MNKNKFGEIVFSEQDICDLLMTTGSVPEYSLISDAIVDESVLEQTLNIVEQTPESMSVEEFDQQNQQQWHMPEEYKSLDIAEHVLNLCTTDAQLQRVGHELLLYQERDLFNLLRYLKYLVDTMKQHGIIWGVGRGSSVASYVLYLLEVHRIDSLYYDLDPEEFLR